MGGEEGFFIRQLLFAIILLVGGSFCYFSWSSFLFSFLFFFFFFRTLLFSARYDARRVTRDNYVDNEVFASRAKEDIPPSPQSRFDVFCNYDREKVGVLFARKGGGGRKCPTHFVASVQLKYFSNIDLFIRPNSILRSS